MNVASDLLVAGFEKFIKFAYTIFANLFKADTQAAAPRSSLIYIYRLIDLSTMEGYSDRSYISFKDGSLCERQQIRNPSLAVESVSGL